MVFNLLGFEKIGRTIGVRRFFPEECKIYQGVAKHTICLKNTAKVLFFLKKSQKIYYFWLAKGENKGPLLPFPVDTNGRTLKGLKAINNKTKINNKMTCNQ